MTDVPEGEIDTGLNTADTYAGRPFTDSATELENPWSATMLVE